MSHEKKCLDIAQRLSECLSGRVSGKMAESLSPSLSCSISHSHSLSLHNLLDIDAFFYHFSGVCLPHGYELHGLDS